MITKLEPWFEMRGFNVIWKKKINYIGLFLIVKL